jgi:hypothetical protein
VLGWRVPGGGEKGGGVKNDIDIGVAHDVGGRAGVSIGLMFKICVGD